MSTAAARNTHPLNVCAISAVAAVGLVLTITLASCGSAEVYENEEYGFSVEIPSGSASCRYVPHLSEHGVIIVFDVDSVDCYDRKVRPHAGISGSYNAAFYTSIEESLQDVCGDGKGGLISAPANLSFKNRHSVACRVPRGDERIMLDVKTAVWPPSEPSNKTEDRLPANFYNAWLFTTPERFEADTERFRAILNTVRILGED